MISKTDEGGASTTLYNHTAINHKQFVQDVIALVPDGGSTGFTFRCG